MTVAADDFSSRPGSATSLVLTIVGLYLRRVGGWIPTAGLVKLAEEAGAPGPLTRTAIARLKKRGILTASRRDDVPGYALRPEAVRMLERGDRRIFGPRNMAPDDAWCLISFSLPEDQRQARHQLRRRLSWIGCGTVAPALWICPDFLRDEVEEILRDLEIRHAATVFRTELPRVDGPVEEAIAQWWDLPSIDALHRDFIKTMDGLLPASPVGSAEAFRTYVIGIDAWRIIPYLDPGLPLAVLPGDWPGRESADLFARVSERLAEPAWRHVRSVVRPAHPE